MQQHLETTAERETVTRTGRYLGRVDGDLVRFRGIRYATAARFAAPVPVPPGADRVLATLPSPVCPQPDAPSNRLFGEPLRSMRVDEDCLRLSITAPADVAADEALPVLVWIHGGSYVSGGGDLPGYDPAVLVREQRVVVVAVTFRLGVLGFLGDGVRVPANLGLLDLIEALRWVRANVAAFGGDADAVTLFGQSAGGDAIAHLMIADGTEGLFRRAVVQSAPLGIRLRRSRMTRLMIAAAGELDAAAADETLFAAHARAHAAARRFGLRAGMPFGSQYGHAPLPAERDADAAWRAAARRVDVLVGWTTEETAFFGELSAGLRRLFRVPLAGPRIRAALIRVTTDAVYRRGGRRFAALLADAGGRVTRYELDWRPDGTALGAAHTTDLPLLFPGPAWAGAALLGSTPWQQLVALGRPLRDAIGTFARTGAVPPRGDGTLRIRPA